MMMSNEKLPMDLTTRHLVDRATDNDSARDSLSYELAVRLEMLMDNPSVDIDVFKGWVRGRSYEKLSNERLDNDKLQTI